MSFEGHPAYQAANIRMQVESQMPMDLLVRTPEFLAERIAMGDFFIQEVVGEGKVIYEADYPVVDATKITARDAIKNCRHVRKVICTAFGLPV